MNSSWSLHNSVQRAQHVHHAPTRDRHVLYVYKFGFSVMRGVNTVISGGLKAMIAATVEGQFQVCRDEVPPGCVPWLVSSYFRQRSAST